MQSSRIRVGVKTLLLLLLALGCSCTQVRTLYYNVPSLAAPSYFDNRPIRPSRTPSPFAKSAEEPVFRLSARQRGKYRSLEHLLKANETLAFVILHNETIVYERYFGKYTVETLLPAFSMSKTYASVMIGRALQDGLLGSMNDRLVDYIPELSRRRFYARVTLDHLLRMVSGIDYNEESPAGGLFYYSVDQRSRMYSYDIKWPPGTHYVYGSVSVQLFWEVLTRRLRGKPLAQYFEEAVWDPLGAEYPASWSLDSEAEGVEKLFGGFNATARDHARIGLLFLQGGEWRGKRIVSKDYVDVSLSVDPIPGVVRTTDGAVRRGKYQWFLTLDGRSFFAKGYHGQYVFVIPDKNVVIVRFGEGYGEIDWPVLYERLADCL